MYLLNTPSASKLGCYPCQGQALGDAVDVAVDPTLLIAGVGVLALAAILFAGKKTRQKFRGFKRARIRRKRDKLQRQLLALGEA